jgi:hypothetical protein
MNRALLLFFPDLRRSARFFLIRHKTMADDLPGRSCQFISPLAG